MRRAVVLLFLILLLCTLLFVTSVKAEEEGKLKAFRDIILKEGGGVAIAQEGGYTEKKPGPTWNLKLSLPEKTSDIESAYLYMSFKGLEAQERIITLLDPIPESQPHFEKTDPINRLAGKVPTKDYDKADFAKQYCTVRYDVTSIVKRVLVEWEMKTQKYVVVVDDHPDRQHGVQDNKVGAYGAALVVIYKDKTKPITRVIIQHGCVWILNDCHVSPSFVLGSSQKENLQKAQLHVIGQCGEPPGEYKYECIILNFDHYIVLDSFDGDDGTEWDVDSFDIDRSQFHGFANNYIIYEDKGDGIVVDVAILVFEYSKPWYTVYPVGGSMVLFNNICVPYDNAELITPLIGLVSAVALSIGVTIAFLKHRRKKQS